MNICYYAETASKMELSVSYFTINLQEPTWCYFVKSNYLAISEPGSTETWQNGHKVIHNFTVQQAT